MRELSIFVDESGDFGAYASHSPYYIVAMVLHDQAKDISEGIAVLEQKLSDLGFSGHCTHAGPIIRQEEEYQFADLKVRQKLLMRMMSFFRNTELRVKTVYIEKKHIADSVEAAGKLAKQISQFVRDNYSFFLSYDCVKVYYDNGQVELSRILSSVFNSLLDNVQFRRVIPSDYRLFQVADMVCTLTLVDLKYASHQLSKSEMLFFGDERILHKNYLKPMNAKRM